MPPSPVALLVTSRHQMFLDGATRLNLDVMPADEARTLLRGIVGHPAAPRMPSSIRWRDAAAGYRWRYVQPGPTWNSRTGLKVADYLQLLAAERTPT